MKISRIRVYHLIGALAAYFTTAPAAFALQITGAETTPAARTISDEKYKVIPLAPSSTSDRGKATMSWTFDAAVDAQVTIQTGVTTGTQNFVLPDSAFASGPSSATKVEIQITRDLPVRLGDEKSTITLKVRAAGTSAAYGDPTSNYTLYVDTIIPNAPGGISAEGADEVLLVSWDAPAKPSPIEVFAEYIVTYSQTDFSGLAEAEVAKLDSKTVEAVGDLTATIDGVENGKTYFVTVRSVDWVGNVSPFPKNDAGGILTASAQPVITLSLAELAGEKGGCFIATAAYGSYQEPHVQILRQFRDQFLLRSAAGERFVDWYYRASPAYALWIAKHDAARAAARVFLLPLYAFAYLMLHPLWALLAGMLLIGIGAARYALPREVAR